MLCQQLQQEIQTRFGFAAKETWLEQVVSLLKQEHAGFVQQPRSMQLQLLLEQLLMADFTQQAGAGGVLPPDVKVGGQQACRCHLNQAIRLLVCTQQHLT